MCEIFNPYMSRAARAACAGAVKTKLKKRLRYRQKIGYEEQGEDFNPGEIFQRSRGAVQTGDQTHGQVIMLESLDNIRE